MAILPSGDGIRLGDACAQTAGRWWSLDGGFFHLSGVSVSALISGG
jgi:hypothetical protein